MKPLLDAVANPSGFDSLSNYVGQTDFGQFYTLITRSRDSDTLTESNWICALELLGGESETVEIHRFGHWACGWWEALAVAKGSPEFAIAEGIEKKLNDYPVLNENHWCEAEQAEADRIWANCHDKKERADYIRKFSDQFEFHGLSDVKACLRGEYFGGYASELIN
jgi:hypothetical protein